MIVIGLIVLALAITFSKVNAQSTAPYANCITFSMADKVVQLGTSEKCDSKQFATAVAYYKTNGYPVEDIVMDIAGIKIMALKTQEWANTVKAMEAIN